MSVRATTLPLASTIGCCITIGGSDGSFEAKGEQLLEPGGRQVAFPGDARRRRMSTPVPD